MGRSCCRCCLGRSSYSLSFEGLVEAVGKIGNFVEVGIVVGVDIAVVDTVVAGTAVVVASAAAEESAVDTAAHTISDSPSVDFKSA